MKKIFFGLIALLSVNSIFSKECSENIRKFIKGNLNDKTQAVRSASSEDAEELTTRAIRFAITNQPLLGNDRELNALAVTGILSLAPNSIEMTSEKTKLQICSDLFNIYSNFEDETVKIAVLNKISTLSVPTDNFVIILNNDIKKTDPQELGHDLLASQIICLGRIGNSDSFKILFNLSKEKAWQPFQNEIENSVGSLSAKSENEILEMIRSGNTGECRYIFNFVTKNSKNSQIIKAEIAENTLLRAIYIQENGSSVTDELVSLQFDSYKVLREMKWTRAAKPVIKYFELAKSEYNDKKLSEENFKIIISGLKETSPIEAVSCLSNYLTDLNKSMEIPGSVISEPVVLEVINTLGAIGDKNAFDSLLAVTYYTYSDTVIAAARSALAKLKW